MTGTSASSDGSPAVTKGIRALRLAALSSAKRVLMRFIALLLPLRGEGRDGDGFAAAGRKPIPSPALPLKGRGQNARVFRGSQVHALTGRDGMHVLVAATGQVAQDDRALRHVRSEEHTSELQSLMSVSCACTSL